MVTYLTHDALLKVLLLVVSLELMILDLLTFDECFAGYLMVCILSHCLQEACANWHPRPLPQSSVVACEYSAVYHPVSSIMAKVILLNTEF